MTRRHLQFTIAAFLALTLVGCGGSDGEADRTDRPTYGVTQVDAQLRSDMFRDLRSGASCVATTSDCSVILPKPSSASVLAWIPTTHDADLRRGRSIALVYARTQSSAECVDLVSVIDARTAVASRQVVYEAEFGILA